MFTVVWARSAERELAEMWNDSPDWRNELTRASESAERLLSRSNGPSLGLPDHGVTRTWVYDPIVITFDVILDDSQIKVTAIRWCRQ